MNRFFVPPEAILAGVVTFPGDLSHQIVRVLRLTAGDKVAVLDNQGSEYQVEITSLDPKMVRGEVRERRQACGEPPVQLTLYLCLTQREKFEWVLQKCTETGVSDFVLVISSRSLVQEKGIAESKIERWQRIVREAAEQCGRGRLPGINPCLPIKDALEQAVLSNKRCLFAWEGETATGLSAVLQGLQEGEQVALLIGPEGGLSDDEARTAVELGWQTVSLGKRIFRMETAAVAASARIIAAYEDPLMVKPD